MHETDPRDVTRIAAAADPPSTQPPANDPDATAPLRQPPTGDPDATVWRRGEGVPVTVTIPGYEILGVLGRGGMGVVYEARHLALKRIVALKMVLSGGHPGPREVTRFRIEAEAVARLQHPNIVQIHEVGESDGHPYLALEFVAGGTLAGKIGGKPLARIIRCHHGKHPAEEYKPMIRHGLRRKIGSEQRIQPVSSGPCSQWT